MEYQHWLREAISQLQASESPRRDAEILLNPVGKLSDQRQLLGIFRHDLADFR